MKGVSPLIAAVLLIALTVTIAIIVTTWSSGFTTSSQVGTENKSKEIVGCSGAILEIEAVYVSVIADGRTNATAVVKNGGLVDNLQIISAQLYTTNGTNISAINLPIQNLDRGGIVTLTFPRTTLTACPGNLSKVFVQSSCPGAADTYDVQYEPPNCS